MAERGLLIDVAEGEGAVRLPIEPGSGVQLQRWRGGQVDRVTRAARAGSVCTLELADLPAPVRRDTTQVPSQAMASWDLVQILPADEAAPETAGGLVIVSMDIDSSVEDEFNDWYSTEHIPLLKEVEGVLTARRFKATRGTPKYVSVYHLDDASRYASPVWLAANETPWMRRMRRFQQNRTYFIFNQRLDR
jgi:hypothetical protein